MARLVEGIVTVSGEYAQDILTEKVKSTGLTAYLPISNAAVNIPMGKLHVLAPCWPTANPPRALGRGEGRGGDRYGQWGQGKATAGYHSQASLSLSGHGEGGGGGGGVGRVPEDKAWLMPDINNSQACVIAFLN